MTTPFTYIITHIPSNVKYYGVRYAKNCHPKDIGKSYFSSSKAVKKLIKEEPLSNFRFEVRKIFKSKEKALIWESKFLNRINAAESDMWFNRHNSNGNPNFYNKKGYKLSKITKDKMKKPKSSEHAKKLAEHLRRVNFIPEMTEERRRQQSEMMIGNTINLGRKLSQETKDKISKKMKDKIPWNKGLSYKIDHKSRICPHCSKEGKGPNMSRYHFDKCKTVTNYVRE